MPDRDIKSDHRTAQAEGWRKVAVGDAKAWKARAEKAEAENEHLREAGRQATNTLSAFMVSGYAGEVLSERLLDELTPKADEWRRLFAGATDDTEARRCICPSTDFKWCPVHPTPERQNQPEETE